MKPILCILIGAVVGLATGYTLKSSKSQPAPKDDLEADLAKLREAYQINKAMKNTGHDQATTQPAGGQQAVATGIETSPAEIIEELKLIRPSGDTRQKSMREIIHYMVSLTKAGDQALPAIDKFLVSNDEVEYEGMALAFQREREAATEALARGEEAGPGGISRLIRSGIGSYFISGMAREIRRELSPRSLRLGLFYVLSDIGSQPAEALLARELGQTRRGLEVAFLDRLLDDMSPGQYEDQVLEVTHDLLKNPPATDGNSLLDEASRMFLFALLIKYNDATFVDTAKTMILTADGRVDGAVVNYLSTILGVQAVPLLHAKLNDPALTNDGDKMALSAAILQHVGVHPSSDAHFKEIVLDKELGGLRYLAVANLSGGDQSEETLRNRQKLIASIKEESDDPVLNGMLDRSHNRIEVTLDPSKKEELAPERGEGFRNLLELFNQGANSGNDK